MMMMMTTTRKDKSKNNQKENKENHKIRTATPRKETKEILNKINSRKVLGT